MEQNTKKCPYCGEEIMVTAKKCRHCGEWLDQSPIEAHSKFIPSKTEESAAPVSRKSMLLNVVILLLIIANLTVAYFWAKDCMHPKSIMEADIAEVENLLEKNTLSTRTDSISYAIGSGVATNTMANPSVKISSYDRINRYKVYAGMLRALKASDGESRRTIIEECWPYSCPLDIESHSTVGKLDGNTIFQGAFDVATSGRTPILNNEDFNTICNSSFKFN